MVQPLANLLEPQSSRGSSVHQVNSRSFERMEVKLEKVSTVREELELVSSMIFKVGGLVSGSDYPFKECFLIN